MEWWGYSKDYGWVFLDRTIKSNKPGEHGELMFIVCNTSEVIFVNRKQWEAPMFVFEKRYMEGMEESELEKEIQLLSDFKDRVNHYKELVHEYLNSKKTDTEIIEKPSKVAICSSNSERIVETKTRVPKTSNNNNRNNILGKWLLFFIPTFIVILIVNQSAFGSCYSGYCISAAFPRVLILSIIISFIITLNSD